MARIARTEAGIARADLLAKIDIAQAQGATPAQVQAIITDDANEFAVAACTRDAFGGRRMGVILDAMIEAQNGRCFFCTETFWAIGDEATPEANGTVPNAFLLVPSQLWADVEVSGYSAHESAYVPGNMVAACTLCTNDRDRATEANGEPVCVGIDSLHPNQIAKILLSFPKGVKKGAINHESARIAKRRAIRIAQVGF
jgi:hypothetical protein